MYQTSNMGNAAFLRSLDVPLTSTRPDGDLVLFEFQIDPAEAERLLATPDRATCARYHRAWRAVRKLIDVSLYGAGQRA